MKDYIYKCPKCGSTNVSAFYTTLGCTEYVNGVASVPSCFVDVYNTTDLQCRDCDHKAEKDNFESFHHYPDKSRRGYKLTERGIELLYRSFDSSSGFDTLVLDNVLCKNELKEWIVYAVYVIDGVSCNARGEIILNQTFGEYLKRYHTEGEANPSTLEVLACRKSEKGNRYYETYLDIDEDEIENLRKGFG